ncbi:MAG: hypothetical protein A3B74_03190 [Candidatus Kerfeldbacteria bacterium RIFCSPHIGHO2_02_FULL_42_14]|uniref:Right handed beta helix domain-containing protein n=1 Tax=Candidatus Kerfeldbacteria bacterium RIFCSPHIGHO2_02_FULL_42_14 TaxID=1798540 RepID=A0A1G2APD6_9BACT|nr:MAG: hypothetical protein A3B74_03190 [Candidatus Kerfeldbacteria bacterium RIFCSPHIGHO2_02_FULL_42_14]OGY80913.1 MAG: hypothetical protein A3E60_03105 [Candidatus Kerfeldbacteria bacterium RIFCSPHIGHO2_12_FULL_42_13]OGY84146.1 MAG: hypothetical protein A3I91_01505 [Candidatus Kerfeldbacteria bacterium RIFCSPLOWO2_02_FULL_42_19]OGY87276.1 MAG: hypothetical protein A3G01_02975 [Candidatus Kerfeldbacteria bacterium RIFCSPLOWO2_12_FULL_43_9]
MNIPVTFSKYQQSFLNTCVTFFFRRKIFFILILFAIIFFAGIVVLQLTEQRDATSVTLNIPVHFVQGLLTQPERLMIDIVYEDYQKIAQEREEALKTGIILTDDADFVPARITHDGKTYDVRMRLKGDWLVDNANYRDKWAFRVEVKNNETLFGMRRFSLHHPLTRAFIYEWIFQAAIRRENLMALRYAFVDVTLNGKHLGTYALEEHFDRLLIENNQRREGVIVRFDEDLHWKNRVYYEDPVNSEYIVQNAPVQVYNSTRVLETAELREQYVTAVTLLEKLRKGELSYSQVFDVEKFARFYALVDLLGASHSVWWANMRLYYDPITARFEPVPYDGYYGVYEPGPIDHILGEETAAYQDANSIFRSGLKHFQERFADIWQDEAMFAAYIQALEQIAAPGYLEKLLSELDPEMQKQLRLIWRSYPQFQFSQETYFRNRALIQKVLHPLKGLHAYVLDASSNALVLSLGNITTLPLEVTRLTYDTVTLLPEERVVLAGKSIVKPVDFQTVLFSFSNTARQSAGVVWNDAEFAKTRVHYKILGVAQEQTTSVYPWTNARDDIFTEVIRQTPNVQEFPFFAIDTSSQVIVIQSGNFRVEKSIIIPSGYTVRAGEGTVLDFVKNASLVSFSPLDWQGTEDSPIIVRSSDDTGQGIAIIQAVESSQLAYVRFEHLSNPSSGTWKLTGAVNFYESPVAFANVEFVGARSEDSLNIIRSQFAFENVNFRESAFDALDIDFAPGDMKQVTFLNSGNDALDISGSIVTAKDIRIEQAGDKGVSVGEASKVTLDDVSIAGVKIGIANKDNSLLYGGRITLQRSDIGIAAFQKKPEFGPSAGEIQTLHFEAVPKPYLLEEGSQLYVNGELIPTSEKDLKIQLYDK